MFTIFIPVGITFAMFLNGGSAPTTLVEDDAIVASMAGIARAALVESHPECGTPTWSFNRDASDGITVLATGTCEFAAGFYRSPETGEWTFSIEGA